MPNFIRRGAIAIGTIAGILLGSSVSAQQLHRQLAPGASTAEASADTRPDFSPAIFEGTGLRLPPLALHLSNPSPRLPQAERLNASDSVGNGILIGALIGAGTAIGLVMAAFSACGTCDAPSRRYMYSSGAAYGAGIGAAAGWAIDAWRK
jgi:hypothetical protein